MVREGSDPGRFAGWRAGDILYDRRGTNVGYFVDDVAYRLDGHYMGELHDDSTLGARSGTGFVKAEPVLFLE